MIIMNSQIGNHPNATQNPKVEMPTSKDGNKTLRSNFAHRNIVGNRNKTKKMQLVKILPTK